MSHVIYVYWHRFARIHLKKIWINDFIQIFCLDILPLLNLALLVVVALVLVFLAVFCAVRTFRRRTPRNNRRAVETPRSMPRLLVRWFWSAPDYRIARARIAGMGGIRQSSSGLASVSKYQFFIKVFS